MGGEVRQRRPLLQRGSGGCANALPDQTAGAGDESMLGYN